MLNAINVLFLKEMLDAAEIFQLEDIRDACFKYYVSVVNDKNCLEFKEIADLRAMTALSEICLNYALKHFLLVSYYIIMFM